MGVDRHLATPGVEILLGVLGRCLLIGPMGLLFFSKKKMVGKDETLEVPFCLFVVCGIFVSPRLFGPSFFFFFFGGGGGGVGWSLKCWSMGMEIGVGVFFRKAGGLVDDI